MPSSDPDPQDQPPVIPNSSHGVSRRTMLIGIAAMIAEIGLLSGSSSIQAQTAAAGNAVDSAPNTTAFLALSQALTGHADLNPETATRIAAAMRDTYPDFSSHADKLTALVQAGQPASALLAAASSDPALHDTALAIVAAWYTGTIGKGQKAIVVSYADALMYQPVRDALPVPTYCSFGPLWWTGQPPSPDANPSASAAFATPTA